MVIYDLDVIRITLVPDKADAPLFVYPRSHSSRQIKGTF